jgi:hypothetical protein
MTVALAFAVAASTVVAWAFWSAAGAGAASAATGSLAAAAITVPGSGINSVAVTWNAQASLNPSTDNAAVTYSVQRKLGAGSWAAVAGGGCSGAKPRGTTGCVDAPAATGSYSYRVVASYHTWTATSNEAGAVSFVLDSVAPTAQSIALLDAGTTNAATVHWTVTFSEPVTGVDTSDFTLAHAGTQSGGSISSVMGSGTTYTVTSSTGSGSGTLGLNLVDDDTITDAGANKLGGSGTGNGNLSGATYAIDLVAPTAISMTRADASPTNAATVHWTVTFSEPVTGVDTTDFALAHTGTQTGGTISSISGTGTTYTVTSSTGSGEGTLGLNLVDDDTIADTLTNKLGGTGAGNGNLTGATYAIDLVAPTAVSILRVDASPTNAATVHWTVTFSEPATGVDTTDFALAHTATQTGGTISSVSGTGTTYTVTSSTGSGDGTLGLNLVDDDTIADAGANKLGGSGTGNGNLTGATYAIDLVAPTAVSILRVDASPTNAATVHWTVTFSEPVTGVDTTDFALTHTATQTGGTISSVSGTGGTYTVTSSTGSGDGTLGLNLVDDDTIADAGANKLGGSGTGNGNLTGATYTIDLVAPTVTSIQRVDTSPANASATVHWTVAFSEPVTGVDITDFTLAHTGSQTGGTISSISGTGTTYTVTSSTGGGDGTLGLNLVDDDTIIDTLTNKLGGTGTGNGNLTGATYTIDNTAPTMSSLWMEDANANGKIDRVTATFSEPLAGSSPTSQWTLSNVPSAATLASVGTAGAVATLSLTEGGGAASTAVGTFKLALAASGSGIRDLAGNQASFAATAPTDKAGPVPIAVSDTTLLFGDGKIELLDTFRAIFSETIAGGVPLLPSITESRAASGNVFLTISGFTDGALDMGSTDYLAGTGVATTLFTGTGLLSGGNTVTITVTVSTSGASLPRAGSGTTMAYRPSPALVDAAGNAATGSIITGFTIF